MIHRQHIWTCDWALLFSSCSIAWIEHVFNARRANFRYSISGMPKHFTDGMWAIFIVLRILLILNVSTQAMVSTSCEGRIRRRQAQEAEKRCAQFSRPSPPRKWLNEGSDKPRKVSLARCIHKMHSHLRELMAGVRCGVLVVWDIRKATTSG